MSLNFFHNKSGVNTSMLHFSYINCLYIKNKSYSKGVLHIQKISDWGVRDIEILSGIHSLKSSISLKMMNVFEKCYFVYKINMPSKRWHTALKDTFHSYKNLPLYIIKEVLFNVFFFFWGFPKFVYTWTFNYRVLSRKVEHIFYFTF